MRVKKGETRASLPDSHKGSPFSGEELVLFSLLAWAMFPSGGLNMSIPQNVDWVALIKEAVHQTVLPLAAEGMAALQGGAVPEDILRDARHAAFSAVLAHERMLYSQDQLLDLMRQADIPCVIIKGLSVASYYPKPELRLLGDIDLLVNLEDKDKACAVLARSEYVEQINPYEKDIGFTGHGALVELHYKMTNYPEGELGDALSEHMAPVVARAMEVNLGSYSFPALTGPDQAILLLDHMQRHIWAAAWACARSAIGPCLSTAWRMMSGKGRLPRYCGPMASIASRRSSHGPAASFLACRQKNAPGASRSMRSLAALLCLTSYPQATSASRIGSAWAAT